VAVLLLVAAAVNGFFTLGQYSWMPVWLPELFPTRSRATALAFTFNAPRFIAFLGPLFAGVLIVQFGGFSPGGHNHRVHLYPWLLRRAVRPRNLHRSRHSG
jgi:MFS family permease